MTTTCMCLNFFYDFLPFCSRRLVDDFFWPMVFLFGPISFSWVFQFEKCSWVSPSGYPGTLLKLKDPRKMNLVSKSKTKINKFREFLWKRKKKIDNSFRDWVEDDCTRSKWGTVDGKNSEMNSQSYYGTLISKTLLRNLGKPIGSGGSLNLNPVNSKGVVLLDVYSRKWEGDPIDNL